MIKKAAKTTIKIISPGSWYRLSRIRRRLWAECKVGRLTNPILIYQMGKVGSSTVAQSLHAAGADEVFHVHCLSGDLSERIRKKQKHAPYPHKRLYIGQALQRRIRRSDFHCKIITLVRDPIARKISGLFQSHRMHGAEITGSDGRIDSQRALRYLQGLLEARENYRYAFEWFDKELKEVFDIDVFAHPFDRDAGYARIEGDKADVLVIRLEQLSELIPTMVSNFSGYDLEVIMARRRIESSEAKAYRTVMQNVTVSPETCRRIYDTPFVQHFYNEHMIGDFIERWSSSRQHTVPGRS